MTAATMTRAPNLNEIATKLTRENPTWTREAVYAAAYRQHTIAMREFSSAVVERVKNDPAVMNAIRVQRAEVEARRGLPPEPDVSLVMSRERTRLMREGYTLDEAVPLALETAREASRMWQRAALQETSVILARDVAKPVTLAVPCAPVARPLAPAQRFVPFGMSRAEAIDQAQRPEGLPIRMRAPRDDGQMRLMDRVRELQASGDEALRDYTAAYIQARAQLAAEDDRAEADAASAAAMTAKKGGGK